MFLSCIKSQTEQNYKSENRPYFPSLIEELKRDNWHKRRDETFLQVAFDKKIIQSIPISISKLTKEDKKNLEYVLAMCNLEEYHIL